MVSCHVEWWGLCDGQPGSGLAVSRCAGKRSRSVRAVVPRSAARSCVTGGRVAPWQYQGAQSRGAL